MLRKLLFVAFVAALHGCASPPLAEPYDPLTMATVQDTADGGGFGGGTFFFAAEVNGQPTRNSSWVASQRASRGQGMNMRLVNVSRPVTAGKVTLKLKALVDFAAPIQSIFAKKREPVEGFIEVELKPGTRYRVTGAMDELRNEVWLEEVPSNQVIGRKIASAPTEAARLAAAADLRYTCCNFHHDSEGWISDANWIDQPFVPAGTPLRVYEVGRDRAKAMVDGKLMWLGLDYGRKQQTMQQLVGKLTSADDPKARIGTWPAEIQAAVLAGKLVPGMTKEQAIVAIGYPRTDTTSSLELPRWPYRTLSDKEFVLVWDAEQHLRAVEASADVRSLVVFVP